MNDSFLAQSQRLLRRARRRPLAVGALAMLVTLAAAGLIARRPARHRAAVTLRFTDTDPKSRIDFGDRALRGHVTEVAFSQSRLVRVAEGHGLLGNGDPSIAVSELRERITVEVIRNRSIALLPPAERPRSAHVRIAFDDADPVRARAVALDLARLVAASGHGQRRQMALAVQQQAQVTAAAARISLRRLRAEAARDRLAGDAEHRPLAAAISAAETRLADAEQGMRTTDLRMRGDGPALEIEVLEPPPARPAPQPGRRAALAAVMAALAALPITALLVGAFDPRLYDGDDVRHLGLSCLGHIGADSSGPRPQAL